MDGISIPRHVAMIMDGNGRWGEKHLLPRSAGHRAGMKRMISLSDHAFSLGVEYFTLFALSCENLARPKEELDALYSLFREYFAENAATLERKGVRLKVIGDLSYLPEDIEGIIYEGETRTAKGRNGTLVLAICYGGRQDILTAANAAIRAGKQLDAAAFSSFLSTAEIPDPDLLIRTGKEKRISNFLLWQTAYTELYFSDKMFPAFTNADFDRAIKDFSRRDRRFGKL